ncbi:Uncharacterised protein [Dorea longicatena]|nr:Uncharacterised protein [Dorea longicatena]
MAEMMWQTERNEMCAERHELSVERFLLQQNGL